LKVGRPLAVAAILVFTLVVIAAPLALSQSMMVSYYGYVMSLQLNVTSAPQLLELPLCSRPYSYVAYEANFGSLYAEYVNGSLQVSVLEPGLVNVSVYGPPCSVSGALATYWIYLPVRANISIANGSVLVYFSGANVTLVNASELEAGPGNLTVEVTVEPMTSTTSTTTTTTSTLTTTASTTTSTSTSTSMTSVFTTPLTTTVTGHPVSKTYAYAAVAAVIVVIIAVAAVLLLRRGS
jgi:Predicted solute binding protein